MSSRLLLAGVLVILFWSGIGPYDRFLWLQEVAPVLIGIPILVATRHTFPLTPIACSLTAFFMAILVVGGHYSYARVPIGFAFQEAFDLSRNHYDRFGHFFQGVIPAVLVRELLLRKTPLRPGGWLFFLVLCVPLAVSASYELLEWLTSVLQDGAADFLGSQGDIWDAQWDMFLALQGALLFQILLGRVHDRQLARLRT